MPTKRAVVFVSAGLAGLGATLGPIISSGAADPLRASVTAQREYCSGATALDTDCPSAEPTSSSAVGGPSSALSTSAASGPATSGHSSTEPRRSSAVHRSTSAGRSAAASRSTSSSSRSGWTPPARVDSTTQPTTPSRSALRSSGATAAARYGWTKLVAREDFSGSRLSSAWGAYDSPGNDGQGRRSPGQVSVSNGILRITGTPDGTTAGIYWKGSQTYGRWEIRARFPAGCGCYHPVVTLWPSDDNWPVGGEVDFAEVFDARRQKLRFFLHYGAQDTVIAGYRAVDMRQWHNFAVEWTPDHMTGYIDGVPYFHTTNRGALPPGRMHQTIQLDWYPGDTKGGAFLDVDWARKYAL